MSAHNWLSSRMYRMILTGLLSLFAICPAGGQTMSVYNIDPSYFPLVKASFFAFDARGNRITVGAPDDVSINEDGIARTVTRVSCPPETPVTPISSVLTIDVSGSMSGMGIRMARAAATAWVNVLQLRTSECAITTFNDRAYLAMDFSTDRAALLTAAQALEPSGGTDYNEALLAPLTGALSVMTHSLPVKKVIVFLTDGKPNTATETATIIAEAKRLGVAVYGVTLGMAAPRIVKDIAEQTGGQWFENITTEAEAVAVYLTILQEVQNGSPCEVEWRSDGCGLLTRLDMALPAYNCSAATAYTVPSWAMPMITYRPTGSINFGGVPPHSTLTLQITLVSQAVPVRIESITPGDPRFRISDYGGGDPPFVIGSWHKRTLSVEFAPSDSMYAFCMFTIAGDACLGNVFYADGGWHGKGPPSYALTVVRPNGGERFVVGSDEVLTWKGVMPEDRVRLEYSTGSTGDWLPIADNVTGLRHAWRVPMTPSDSCVLRATVTEPEPTLCDMAYIPAGTFQMGDITGNGPWDDEHPVHEVTISHAYLIGRTEVTQGQWRTVMGGSPAFHKGNDNLPVEMVSSYDAMVFCNSLSVLEGLEPCYTGPGGEKPCNFEANGYRLPTEAEWEYACRGGTTMDYHTGNMAHSSCSPLDAAMDMAGWYCGNDSTTTQPVKSRQPNLFGLFDTHGNVWEWCWDYYQNSYYSSSPSVDPRGPAKIPGSGYFRVWRGGAYDWTADDCRSAHRHIGNPAAHYKNVGFRIMRRLP